MKISKKINSIIKETKAKMTKTKRRKIKIRFIFKYNEIVFRFIESFSAKQIR